MCVGPASTLTLRYHLARSAVNRSVFRRIARPLHAAPRDRSSSRKGALAAESCGSYVGQSRSWTADGRAPLRARDCIVAESNEIRSDDKSQLNRRPSSIPIVGRIRERGESVSARRANRRESAPEEARPELKVHTYCQPRFSASRAGEIQRERLLPLVDTVVQQAVVDHNPGARGCSGPSCRSVSEREGPLHIRHARRSVRARSPRRTGTPVGVMSMIRRPGSRTRFGVAVEKPNRAVALLP